MTWLFYLMTYDHLDLYMGGAFQTKLVGQNDSLTGCSATLTYKNKKLNPEMSKMWQFCMAKVRNHCFRARKSPNLPKVGVAKQKVGGANHKVGGAAAPPTVGIGNSARACRYCGHRALVIIFVNVGDTVHTNHWLCLCLDSIFIYLFI